MKTHNLSLDGVNGFVMDVKNKGREITISGWTNHWKWENGDNLILTNKDQSTTRYKIISIDRPGNPPDQYFLNAKFHPRKS